MTSKKRISLDDAITFKTKKGNEFIYTKFKLIALVREHPEIWQQHLFNYARPETWNKIATELDNDFRTLTLKEKEQIVKALIKRWNYTRSAYFRFKKINKKRPYAYEKELAFLLTSPNDNEAIGIEDIIKIEADSTLIQNEFTFCTNEEFNENSAKVSTQTFPDDDDHDVGVRLIRNSSAENLSLLKNDESNANVNANKSSKRQRTSSTTQVAAIEKYLKDNLVPQQLPPQLQQLTEAIATTSSSSQNRSLLEAYDADQSFFDSIKPMICNWSKRKKFNFQIEVLKIIRDIDTEMK